MGQIETIENLLKKQEFLEEHGTDLKVVVKGLEFTLYFIGGKYNTEISPEENESLTGIRKKGKIYVDADFCVKVKWAGGEKEFFDAEIL